MTRRKYISAAESEARKVCEHCNRGAKAKRDISGWWHMGPNLCAAADIHERAYQEQIAKIETAPQQ